MKLFQNKTILITGGASGIGKAMVRLFCEEGGTVIIVDIHEDEGRAVTDNLVGKGYNVTFYKCDVSKKENIEVLVDSLKRDFQQLDVLCNNAGVELDAPFEKTDEKDWDRLFDVNVKGMFLLTQLCLPLLKKGEAPAVINTGSISGLIGWPASTAYCASKGAVVMLTKQMAVDLAKDGIRVNCICPGTTKTGMIDRLIGGAKNREQLEEDIKNRHLLGRFAEPEEIAASVLFLASEEASFITGTILPVDGGYTAK